MELSNDILRCARHTPDGLIHLIGAASPVKSYSSRRKLLCASLVIIAACSRERTVHASSRLVKGTGEIEIDSVPSIEFWSSGDSTGSHSARATGGTRLSTGEIVIADSKANQVRIFDTHGQLVRVLRKTEGFEQGFQAAYWVGNCDADSIFVWDPRAHRIVVFDANGRFARANAQPANLASMSCSAKGVMARVMSPSDLRPPSANGRSPRALTEVQLSTPRGDTTASIPAVPFVENRPLGRGTFVSIGGTRVYVGTADSEFVDSYSLDGKKLSAFRVADQRRQSPSRQQYEAAIDLLVDGFLSDDDREHARKYLDRIPMPQLLPPYSGLFGSDDGTIWANASAFGDSLTVLRGVSAVGRFRGEVRIPFAFTVFAVGPDYILGAYDERRDEQRVVLYRFRAR